MKRFLAWVGVMAVLAWLGPVLEPPQPLAFTIALAILVWTVVGLWWGVRGTFRWLRS